MQPEHGAPNDAIGMVFAMRLSHNAKCPVLRTGHCVEMELRRRLFSRCGARRGTLELRRLGRILQRRSRRLAAGNSFGNGVEIAGADFALMPRGAVAMLLSREFRLLQF